MKQDQPDLIIEGAPVHNGSLEELLENTDVSLMVRVSSEPQEYLDFGQDGMPDYEDQPGMPVELVDAEVVKVYRGSSELLGTTISVSQPSLKVQATNGSRAMDRLKTGEVVLILASSMQANPGVGPAGKTVYTPSPWGQGIFDSSDGKFVFARIDEAIPGLEQKDSAILLESLVDVR